MAVAILMALEPHASGMILLLGIGAVMLVVGGIHWLWVAGGVSAAGLGVYLMLFTDLMEKIGYNSDRITTWRDPWWDVRGESWQMAQSLITIGLRRPFGGGPWGRAGQKFMFLPEGHNDFIFAVVCEELGLVGATLIMLLFSLLIIRGYWLAIHAKDRFGSLLVVGVTTQIALQTFLNIAVVTGLIPATGISLPFFSYCGTALAIQLVEGGGCALGVQADTGAEERMMGVPGGRGPARIWGSGIPGTVQRTSRRAGAGTVRKALRAAEAAETGGEEADAPCV